MVASREYCVVVPLEPLAVGDWVARSEWPRHITICPNFRVVDGGIDVLAAALRRFSETLSAPTASVGANALFGPAVDEEVQLVDSNDVERLHLLLTESFADHLSVEPVNPAHHHTGYRAHITVHGQRLPRGPLSPVADIAIVEIAPDGDSSTAVVVAAARFGETADGGTAIAELASVVCQTLEKHGIRFWVIGGWGIDALLHRQTREHHDLDLFVHSDDVDALLAHIRSSGSRLHYLWSENRWHERRPSAFVARILGIDVDVHIVEPIGDRVRILSAHSIELPRDALGGSGTIAGRTVTCATGEAQLVMHSGYEMPEHQKGDLRLLRNSI